MADITLRSSRIDDSWHAEKGGSIIASGSYKAVLADAETARGPGDRIIRGSSIAMRHPPTPAAIEKARKAATPPKAAEAKPAAPPKAAAPSKGKGKGKGKGKPKTSASRPGTSDGSSDR